MTSRKKNYTAIYANGRVIGGVSHDGVLSKRVKASKHFLKVPPAIAWDTEALSQAAKAGAYKIEVTDIEAGVTYGTTLHHFMEHAFSVNRGWGCQLALPLDGWTKRGKNASSVSQLSFAGMGG